MPVQVNRAAHPVDQRGDVLDLPLDCIRERVAAVAATSPVVVDGSEVLGERLSRRTHEGAVTGGTTDSDQRGPLPEDLVGDRGAVSGSDRLVRHTSWTRERGTAHRDFEAAFCPEAAHRGTSSTAPGGHWR